METWRSMVCGFVDGVKQGSCRVMREQGQGLREVRMDMGWIYSGCSGCESCRIHTCRSWDQRRRNVGKAGTALHD